MRHRSPESIQNARILARASKELQLFIHFLGMLLCELSDSAHFEEFEIAEHCRADGDKIFQSTGVGQGPSFLVRFIFAKDENVTLFDAFVQEEFTSSE